LKPTFKKSIFHGFTSVVGIVFYFFGLFTLFNILQRFVSFPIVPGTEITVAVLEFLFLCYVVLNFFIGYGLVNRRRWALSVSLINTALLLGLGFARYFGMSMPQYADFSVFFPPVVFAIMAGILYLNREFLNEDYINLKIIIPFATLLLITIFSSNTISAVLYAH
jgi:hypothetical protein